MNCFQDKSFYQDYNQILNYRNKLLRNKSVINVRDFGAGSKVLSDKSRKTSSIAKKAGITKKRAKLLYRIVNYFQAESILELGTSLGMATSALSLGNPNGKVLTIEGCPETATIARKQFEAFNLNNIHIVVKEFEDVLNDLSNTQIDLIFIDGNHRKKSTINYFKILSKHVTNDSLMIFDDIHWSKEMSEAWETIKDDPKVTVSIDTFYWGIVFFRCEQMKQHFKIRL